MKNKMIRYMLNGVILAAVAAIGIAAYQIGSSPTEEKIIREMENTEQEEFAMLEEGMAEDEDINGGEDFEDSTYDEEAENMADLADSGDLESSGDLEDIDIEENESFVEESGMDSVIENFGDNVDAEKTETASVESEFIDIEVPEEDWEAMDTVSNSELMKLHFSDNTEMQWPTNGEILLDYNMNQTIYFPTLDQYKLNPAIAVQAEEGTPILAAASGLVYDIKQNAQTGTTVTMELGDGYQAIYGQLKDLTVEEGERIEKGTVIGYISEPTKYYSVEGSNLYFSMKRNGEYVNPKEYLPEKE